MQEREVFFELHPDPMWVFDEETLDFLDVNEAAVRTYGFSRSEFLQMKVTGIRASEDVPAFLASLAEGGGYYNAPGIWRHRTKSGEPLMAQVRAHRIAWNGRRAVLVSVRRIGDMVEADHERVTLLRREDAMRRAAGALAAQLAEQNANLRTTQRLIKIGTWKYEIWSDRIIWSPEIHEMYAIPPGQFGENFDSYMELIHPDDRAAFLHNYQEFERTDAPLFEFQHRRVLPDGRTIHVRGVAEATQTQHGRLLTGVAQDVTRSVEQSQRLHLLDLSVGRLNDVVLIFEAAKAEAVARAPIVYVNAAFLRHTGLTYADVLGQPVASVMAQTSPGVPLGVLADTLHQETSLRSDIRIFARSGRIIPAEIDLVPVRDPGGTLTHWVAVIRDMTEKHAAEEQSRAHETRYQMLARSTQDVVWDMDLGTGLITWNENFREISGDPHAELVSASSDSWTGRIHPDDRERVVGSFYDAAANQEENWAAEYRFMRDAGDTRYVFDRGYFYRDHAGTAVRAVGSMVDITSQKLAEVRLLQTEKLEALGQITGGVAHDFNNLLTIILGNTETLLDRAVAPLDHRLLELMANAAERGRELTGRLLTFARRLPLRTTTLDLNVQIARLAELLKRTFPPSIRIEVEPCMTCPCVDSDPGQLELVLLNLAVNARDAITGEGVLTLSTAVAEIDGKERVILRVTDTGTGMDAETLRRCLEPFFTTKPVGKGVGLGLSMAFGFMSQSGGQLQIDSVPGKGTCAALIFPPSSECTVEPVDAKSGDAPVGGDEHVLLVEDDPGVREHVSRLLSDLGYRVTRRKNADAAIAYVQQGGRADVLLTDLVMPGSATALDLVAVARAAMPGLAVLISSGYPRELAEQMEQADWEDMAVDFLPKPYRRTELAGKLRAVLQRVGRR